MSDVAGEPAVVYHYTTIDSMIKIAESASIWATSISYLNDVSEGEHYCEQIRKRISYRGMRNQNETPLAKFLYKSDPQFENHPFVASFSQDADSLPQWRSYCSSGNGVAVGFRVDCLQRAFVKAIGADRTTGLPGRLPDVSFRVVDYLDESDQQSLDEEIDNALRASNLIASRGPLYGYSGTDLPADVFRFYIEQLACFKKHPSFSNEREYRLLVDKVFSNSPILEFRPTRSTLIPYIPVCIPRKHSSYKGSTKTGPVSSLGSAVAATLGGRWDFIDRVVVGPTANKNLSTEAIASYFRKQDMNVEVVPSTIPYRDW